MKLIVEKTTGQVKYVFPDDALIELQFDRIMTPYCIIADMNERNAELIEGIESIPPDYIGCKYLYEDGEFTLNPEYVEPH